MFLCARTHTHTNQIENLPSDVGLKTICTCEMFYRSRKMVNEIDTIFLHELARIMKIIELFRKIKGKPARFLVVFKDSANPKSIHLVSVR